MPIIYNTTEFIAGHCLHRKGRCPSVIVGSYHNFHSRRDRPMPRIVPAITTLLQHLHMLSNSPEVYRPSACPHCGLGGLWSHGCYERKADRGPHSSGTLNPIPIPRYFCRGCGRTCSRLPQCIAPRRWYGWAVQQLVLQLLLAGCSLHRCACWMGLDRRTAGHWLLVPKLLLHCY